MLQAGTHLWNAGIFLFSVNTVMAAFETHAQGLIAPVARAVRDARPISASSGSPPGPGRGRGDFDRLRGDGAGRNLSVVPFAGGWSDLGGWDAVWRETRHEAGGWPCRARHRDRLP